MAELIKCRTCGKEVSKTAPTCPHCGENFPWLHIKCPRCSTDNIEIRQKGFGIAKAAVGGVFLGPAGLLTGFIGRKKLKLTCPKCGYNWKSSLKDLGTDYGKPDPINHLERGE